MFWSITLTYNSIRQDLLLNLELGWWPTSPRDFPLSSPQSVGLQAGVRTHPAFYLGCRDLNSGVSAWKAALIHIEASPQLPGHVFQGMPLGLYVLLSMPSSKGSKNWDACWYRRPPTLTWWNLVRIAISPSHSALFQQPIPNREGYWVDSVIPTNNKAFKGLWQLKASWCTKERLSPDRSSPPPLCVYPFLLFIYLKF